MNNHRNTWRVAVAGFHLESASFLPQISSLHDFEAATTRGSEVINAYAGTNTVPGGMLKVCQDKGLQTVPLVYAFLGALGPASDEAVTFYAQEMARTATEAQVDGVLLHLHGACWAPGFDDVERHMVDELRRVIGPATQIVVAFDYHGNIDHKTIERVDAAYAYRLSPHTDMGQTGERAALGLWRILDTGQRPALAIAKPGLIVPSIFSATALRPLSDILAQAGELESRAGGDLDISIMAGFSYADAHNTGFSVVAVSWQGQEAADAAAMKINNLIQQQKAQLYSPEPVMQVEQAVDMAMSAKPTPGKPVVLLEHADRINDSTYVLNALIDKTATRAYVPFLWDNKAAQKAHEVGAGNRITVSLGGWSSDRAGPRVEYDALILSTGTRSYRISGQMLRGQRVDLGMTALLQIGGVVVSVVSNFAFTVDEDVYTAFDLNIEDFDIVVLRSKTHFRQFFEPVASQILIVDTPDYGPADLTRIPYARLNTDTVYPHNAREGS